MRNQKRPLKPQKKHAGQPSKSKSKLWIFCFFALITCGVLLAGYHWVRTSKTNSAVAGVPATTSTATKPAPALSMIVSQLPSEMVQAPESAGGWGDYVGDAACLPCHHDKVTTYHQTAHYLTSSWPTKDSIHGSFIPGFNILKTRSTNLFFRMDANEKGFFQTAVLGFLPADIKRHTERFDIVFGSGRKGQTYLYWHGDRLFELPVSYWVERGTWMNSPGVVEFPDGDANFTRAVNQRCLECHVTGFEWIDTHGGHFNRFTKTNLILGITCEKCHGAAREHIALFRSPSPPPRGAATAIINPAKLSRARQMDGCGLCHAGAGRSLAPALSFKAGGVLSNYLEQPMPGPEVPVDVHGNQIQLLERSRCFKSSSTMTCATCHDVHVPQRDIKAFATRCLNCHHVEDCGTFPKRGHVIDNECVRCHMPLQKTGSVLSKTEGKKFQPEVRNHQIAIYPDVPFP